MKDDKLLLYILIGVLVLLITIVIVVPYFAFSGSDRTFPPKPPIPGFDRSPAIDRLAP